jgi:hypothetical protein
LTIIGHPSIHSSFMATTPAAIISPLQGDGILLVTDSQGVALG